MTFKDESNKNPDILMMMLVADRVDTFDPPQVPSRPFMFSTVFTRQEGRDQEDIPFIRVAVQSSMWTVDPEDKPSEQDEPCKVGLCAKKPFHNSGRLELVLIDRHDADFNKAETVA